MDHGADERPASIISFEDGALSAQLANAVILASNQNQIVWTVFGIFWAADAILLAALFTTGGLPKLSTAVVVSAAGVVLSLIWYLIQKRAIGYLNFYDAVVEELERRIAVPAQVALSGRINVALHDSNVPGRVPVKPLMIACGVVSAILWGAALVWFACRLTSA